MGGRIQRVDSEGVRDLPEAAGEFRSSHRPASGIRVCDSPSAVEDDGSGLGSRLRRRHARPPLSPLLFRGGADVVDLGIRKEDLKVVRGGWDILKRNVDRIMGLTTNMLAFSRQRDIEIELTQIGPIVQECAQLLEDQCRDKSIAMLVDRDEEMPPIPIDAGLIHQALMNLMTNAVEAVESETGAVTVRTTFHPAGSRGEHSPPMAEINVIDNGPGIAPDRIGRIFEPFHTTKGTRGTGLGLAVTRRIIEEHRGQISVESDEGIGTVFQIMLSAAASGPVDPAATAAAGAGLAAGPVAAATVRPAPMSARPGSDNVTAITRPLQVEPQVTTATWPVSFNSPPCSLL